MKAITRHTERAMATVIACHYEFGAGQALAFGIPKSKQFQITFNYWANGELHTGEFASAKAIPQGTLFPINYDPDAPHEHDQLSDAALPRVFILLGIVVVIAIVSALCAYLLHA